LELANKRELESINARVFIYFLAVPILLLYGTYMRIEYIFFTNISFYSLSTYRMHIKLAWYFKYLYS
jgi:hypothetical protein